MTFHELRDAVLFALDGYEPFQDRPLSSVEIADIATATTHVFTKAYAGSDDAIGRRRALRGVGGPTVPR